MGCPSCAAENPDGNRFCGSCGTALARVCVSCGARNPPANRFCGECGVPQASDAGSQLSEATTSLSDTRHPTPDAYTPRHLAEKIVRSRTALEGEHKQITALFADVVDSTPLAEQLGPEETHALIRRCFDLMLEAVHRYEGTVSQFTGDGILALFGAPIAHEDHAQRAVRAALTIQQALGEYRRELREQRGINLQVRVGLNSGPVVVGTIGTDLNMTYTAIGDTVNLASRIQGLAEPGAVVISEATQRLVRGYFVTRDLGQHPVKGKEQAVGLREVLRPSRLRTRLDVYAEQGLSPLVGRHRELTALEECFARARAGHGSVAFIAGDPGIGKSRLLHELKRRLEGESLAWREGRCIAYGRDIAYLPIVDLLKDSFDIHEADAEADIVRKSDHGTRTLGDDVLAGRPFLRFLLSVDPGDPSVATMDPQLRKARVFEALRALALASCAVSPLVIVLEDLHWIDRLSEEVVSYLVDAVAGQRILLLLTCRPGYEHPFGARPYFTDLRLAPLSEAESALLAGGMLAADRLPDELQRIVAAKAEGNPFFVEEVVKSLLEIGVLRGSGDGYVLAKPIDEIYVPDTIQDVVMARLDRLDEEPKRALQTAAVIGREFGIRLLERTTELHGRIDGYLRELKSIELIFERSLYPELAYMFKHALTHDVAYNSLLATRRRVLHRVVGDAIEELYRDRLAEQSETLAYHYEQAEAWDKALDYLEASGDKALAAFAPHQAVAFYDRALVVAEKAGRLRPPERQIALHAGHGRARLLTNDWDRSAESFRAMGVAAEAAGDLAQEGLALYRTSLAYLRGHRLEDALEFAARSQALAEETGDQTVLAGSLVTAGWVRAVTGDLDAAIQAMQMALPLARQSGNPTILGLALHQSGSLTNWQGDHVSALKLMDEAYLLARQHQEPMVLMWVEWLQLLVRCGLGDYDGALQHTRDGLELSERLGERFYRGRILNTVGWLYGDLCNWDLALEYNAQSLAVSRVVGDVEIIRNAELNLGDCHLALGQLDEAQRYLEGVERESRRQHGWGEMWMKWRYTQHLTASLGELWLARGELKRAQELADQTLSRAQATRALRNVVKARRLKGEALLALGRPDLAELELVEGLGAARRDGNPVQLWKTLAVLGQLRMAQARHDDAMAAYREAVAIVERMADGLADSALRETLLGSSQVAGLREALAESAAVARTGSMIGSISGGAPSSAGSDISKNARSSP